MDSNANIQVMQEVTDAVKAILEHGGMVTLYDVLYALGWDMDARLEINALWYKCYAFKQGKEGPELICLYDQDKQDAFWRNKVRWYQ